ncbi:MAG: hypothetical protein ACJATK_003092, partial [Paracoccaceae bacterium]
SSNEAYSVKMPKYQNWLHFLAENLAKNYSDLVLDLVLELVLELVI